MMKNFAIRLFVRLAQKLIPRNPSAKRILIVSTTALGDTLWAAPAIENLRRTFPKAYLALLTRPVGLEIFKHSPHLDKIYLLKNLFSLWKQLRRERFDTVLLFHASQRPILPLCSLIGAERIIATSGINKGLDGLLTHPLDNFTKHEIVRRLEIAEAIGAKRLTEALSLFLLDSERLPKRGGRWIALHPGAKDRFKRWPASHFIELGRLLKEAYGCEILITGNPEEKPLMEQIASQIPGARLYEAGTSLRSFAALLEGIDLLISNDTGPVHLACALKRPVIALYSATDPGLCGPHTAPQALALSKPPTCSPCLKKKCREPFCLLQISPREVFAAAQSLISQQLNY